MQLALDVSVAEAVSPPGAASTDTIIFPERNAAPHQRSRIAEIPASWRPNARLKHAPPDLMAAGSVTVSFVKSADAESARRFLDAVSLLRQWGRDLLTSKQPAALEAAMS